MKTRYVRWWSLFLIIFQKLMNQFCSCGEKRSFFSDSQREQSTLKGPLMAITAYKSLRFPLKPSPTSSTSPKRLQARSNYTVSPLKCAKPLGCQSHVIGDVLGKSMALPEKDFQLVRYDCKIKFLKAHEIINGLRRAIFK